MGEHVSSDTARAMIADPYCPITTRCMAEDILDARAEIARLTADLAAARELRGVVTAAAHARAVREAWQVFCRPLYADRGRGASDADIAEHWRECDTRTQLVARLVGSGLTEAQAGALADGVPRG